jgi:hypothetical protein
LSWLIFAWETYNELPFHFMTMVEQAECNPAEKEIAPASQNKKLRAEKDRKAM